MDEAKIQRKLTAIFSADVVGYSRLMRADEIETINRISEYRRLMSNLVVQHKGRVVDASGDNILAEFTSVVDAVQSAVTIQREIKARNAKLPEDRQMAFRIGINIGDVVQEDDRIYGDGVNIAARLESIAEPGGICISRSAYDQIESKLPFGYAYIGEQKVKNIDKPLYAYRVLLDPENDGRTDPPGNTAQAGKSPAEDGLPYRMIGKNAIHGKAEEDGAGGQTAAAIRDIKDKVHRFSEEMRQDPEKRRKTIVLFWRQKQVRFAVGFGVLVFAINLFTYSGSWWFLIPFLAVCLGAYFSWIRENFPTFERAIKIREGVMGEEIARFPEGHKPSTKEMRRIERRINRCHRFYKGVYAYIGVNVFLLLLNLLTTPLTWWFQYPLAVWGFLLFLQRQKMDKILPG